MGIWSTIGTVAGAYFGMPMLGTVGAGVDSYLSDKNAQNSQQATNEWNAQQAQLNRDFQDQQAKRQMDFQERMRGTQYQTAVKDMQAAGLNPMLAYSQGGAGTPSGAAGSGSQSSPALNKVSAGMSSAQQSAQTAQALQSLELNRANIEQVQATTDKIRSETVDQQLNSALTVARARSLNADASVTETRGNLNKAAFQADLQNRQVSAQRAGQDYARETETFSADVAKRKAENTLTQSAIPSARAEAKFWEDFRDAPQILKLLMQVFGASHSAASILRR